MPHKLDDAYKKLLLLLFLLPVCMHHTTVYLASAAVHSHVCIISQLTKKLESHN